GLELGAERDQARLAVHVERLLSDAVADEGKLPPVGVPDGDREHPHEPPHGPLDAPAIEGGQDDLAVATASKAAAGALQLVAELVEVIDLAVEDHDEPARGRPHRLVPVDRQVEDGEPPEPEGD